MQDLAPFEDLHRMRAEFAGMVSHEAPPCSAPRNFAPAETREFLRIIDEQANHMIGLITDLPDAGAMRPDACGRVTGI